MMQSNPSPKEFLRLEESDRGSLRWDMEFIPPGTYPSRLLGRSVDVIGELTTAQAGGLGPEQHAALAKRLVGAYLQRPI